MNMTVKNTSTATASLLRRSALLLALPLALWLAGCDSNGSNGDDPDPDPGEEFIVAAYDTMTVDGADAIVVSDDEGGGIGYTDVDDNEVTEVTWTNDHVYILDGFVFVNDGQSLTIEPGTVIKAEPGTGENASALIVARGGTITADGENDDGSIDPIIFTAKGDNVEDAGDLPSDARGLWGGVIILGSAPLNTSPGEQAIEGIPTEEPRGIYGGDAADDNSGTFRYVSIRYGGSNIGAGNEINGLTMGGVGNGTTIEYVEVYNNEDDGFEWFGGTVNTKYLISAFNGDDSFDIDQGWSGKNQYWFAIQGADEAGRIAEQDGGTDPEDGTPYATPVIYNATYVGIGPGESADGDSNDPYLYFRDNNASSYYNSIFMDAATTEAGLHIEDLDGGGEDSRARFEDGDLKIENNLWWNIGADYEAGTTTFEDIIQVTYYDDDDNENTDEVPVDASFRTDLADYLSSNGNELLDVSPVQSIDRSIGSGALNPLAAGDATSGAPSPGDSFFDNTGFYGAFGTENWAADWTFLSAAGYFSN